MKRLNAETGPRMVLEISDAERAVAKQIKDDCRKILTQLNDAVRVITDLRDAIGEERPSRDDLKGKYRGRLLRYRRKILEVFNIFLSSVKKTLEKLSKVNDPEMVRLREIIIAEIGELSDGAEAVVDLLEETDREGFTKTLEQVAAQIEKREKSIIDVIDNQLTNHVDHDIFGKMKISEMRFRIKRRSRLIQRMIKEATNGNN